MPTLETYNGYPLWHYIPNRPAAIIFIVLFLLATISHFILMSKHRTWFCIPFIIGGIFECIGYLGRALAYNETGELIPYLLQSIFLLLAPILFAATLYMTLGRIIIAVDGARYSPISPRWLTRIFVTTDVISFLVQGGGAGILVQSSSASKATLGQNIIVGGLVFQLVAFFCYIVTTVVFRIRAGRSAVASTNIPWKEHIVVLYLTSILIMIRNIFRAIQYAKGEDGYLLTHEWTTYVMDGMLMFFVMVIYGWKYPSKLHGVRKANRDVELVAPETPRHKRRHKREPRKQGY